MTAFHIAAEKGFVEIVKILIEHGSNIHLQDNVFSFSFFFVVVLFLLFFF